MLTALVFVIIALILLYFWVLDLDARNRLLEARYYDLKAAVLLLANKSRGNNAVGKETGTANTAEAMRYLRKDRAGRR